MNYFRGKDVFGIKNVSYCKYHYALDFFTLQYVGEITLLVDRYRLFFLFLDPHVMTTKIAILFPYIRGRFPLIL